MPLLPDTYSPPLPLRVGPHGHLGTLWPVLVRRVTGFDHSCRHRLETADGDFIDVDGHPVGRSRAVLICHGLEGHSRRRYVLGMGKQFHLAGFDVWALNYRGCSGEPNRLPSSYHSGKTEDLALVVNWLAPRYASLSLAGFSLGGNLILKYLGESREDRPAALKSAVAISAPTDLGTCACRLERPENWLYQRRFLDTLKEKAVAKSRAFPDLPSPERLARIRTLREFDDVYTGPVHGFGSAVNYYRQCSSRKFLPSIACPTLLLSAQDDPLLTRTCHPVEEAKRNPHLHLCLTQFGGHTGYYQAGDAYWSDQMAVDFIHQRS